MATLDPLDNRGAVSALLSKMIGQSGNCSARIPGINRNVEGEFDVGAFKSINVIGVVPS